MSNFLGQNLVDTPNIHTSKLKLKMITAILVRMKKCLILVIILTSQNIIEIQKH